MGGYIGAIILVALLIILLWICSKCEEAEKNPIPDIVGACSERRLYNLNELTYFKIVRDKYNVVFCRVLSHKNNVFDHDSFYYLYYESIDISSYRKGLEYSYKSNDYSIIQNADKMVCSERDNFLNNAIPITEIEYESIKQKFIETINSEKK